MACLGKHGIKSSKQLIGTLFTWKPGGLPAGAHAPTLLLSVCMGNAVQGLLRFDLKSIRIAARLPTNSDASEDKPECIRSRLHFITFLFLIYLGIWRAHVE